MQRKDLALRVLSTAAIMSIVTSIAAPAFADIYYIGNGSIDVVTKEDADGKKYVEVKQGDKTYTDTSDEIVIKDGNNEGNAAQKEENRIEGKKAKVAIPNDERPATQELEAAGSADAAGESQPDPDAGFTLNETGEDSAQTQEGKDTTEEKKDPSTENPTENPTANPTEDTPKPSTENPTENPKKDVVYQYDPADPEPEQQATKPAPTTSADPTAETREATQTNAPAAAPTTPTAPAADPPAEGSAKNPSKNVIRVINDWAEKVLNIRLSNVNIKASNRKYQAAMDVSGGGTTKIELDGQNALDSSSSERAGLHKQVPGKLIITDETDDRGNKITAPKSGTSGSLTAKGGGTNGSAGIGGSVGESTGNIIIEGYATVDATGGGSAAGIGGGGSDNGFSGSAYNITIQGHSKVTASAYNGAAIGSGSAFGGDYGGSATGIVIRDHATVVAKSTGVYGASGYGAAIGAAGYSGKNTEAEVTIGTPGATTEDEDVNIIATGFYGSAIGNGAKDTKVTIQGHATIQTASSQNDAAIGSESGNVEVTIKDNVSIDNEDTVTHPTHPLWVSSGIGGGYIASNSGRTVKVTIDGGENGQIEIGKKSAITGPDGAISGTEVKIGNNVLLKMKGRSSSGSRYITENMYNNEAAVGTRSNPTAGGLVNTIGDNTELWYTDYNGVLQKIVHSKNLCTEELVDETPATCTTPGSKTYKCTFESNKGAASPEHTETRVETTNALGHDFTVKQSETPATCERAGTIVWKCSRCDETKTETIPATGHHWTDNGDNSTHICVKGDATEAHSYGEWTTVTEATCTTAGKKQHTCTKCGHVETQEIPATGHHWKDNGDGTHTCPDCGATEGQPVNTNSALELRVVDAEGMDQPFTVSQNGTLRTYTGAYDIATLTGDLNTLRYLQEHGAQTIQFVTNGQTSSFDINDLLAQGSGSEVFYLTHRGTEEPTLLLVEADHSELVKD